MSKRSIAYVKPQEPAFLARLKNQIGYKDGPTVETKKQKVENFSDSDDDSLDREGERPTVVVLNKGDLTAEEAAQEEARIEKEAAEAPADLTQRIIFKARKVKDSNSKENLNKTSSRAAGEKGAVTSSTSSSSHHTSPLPSSLSSSTSSSRQPSVKREKGESTTEKTKNSSKNKKKNESSKLSFTNEDEEYEEEQ